MSSDNRTPEETLEEIRESEQRKERDRQAAARTIEIPEPLLTKTVGILSLLEVYLKENGSDGFRQMVERNKSELIEWENKS